MKFCKNIDRCTGITFGFLTVVTITHGFFYF